PPVAPTWHRPDCPPGLEALILRLLKKDPAKRPASAKEVGEILVPLTLTLSQGERGHDGGPRSALDNATPDGRQPIAGDPLYRSTFVGRETELKQLQAAFDAAGP